MSVIGIEELLSEVSPEAPCGENLEYDPAYGEMERAAAGKEEQQFGDTIVPAEEPNWREVRRRATDLLKQSKDLRIGMYLTRALTHTDGIAGLHDGVELLKEFVARFWDQLHPQLDPDDDNDPTLRINTLTTLCHHDALLAVLREKPLVASRAVGTFSLRDVQIANGEMPPTDEEAERPDPAVVEAAFADCDLEELQKQHHTVEETIEHVQALERSLTERVGGAYAPNFDDLVSVLQAMHKILHDRLDKRGAFQADLPDAEPSDEQPEASNGEAAAETVAARPAQRSGEIRSRDDVIRALDQVCAYYDKHEPSSPLPLLLKRAKRLATMSFMEIVRELTPDGVGQAEAIAGLFGGSGEDGDSDNSD